MVSLSQAKDLFKMQRQAKKIQKELKTIHVEADAEGVVVTVSAEQEIVDVVIPDTIDVSRLPALIKDATNRAMKKAQVVAAEKMQSVMGDMGLPTDLGMRGMSQ